MKLIFVTGNSKKFVEAKAVLEGVDLVQERFDITEIQGSAMDVVKDKARKALAKFKKPLFVEDTSLEFSALGGLPGPYIIHFLDAIGPEGLYRILKDYPDKRARAVCLAAYIEPGTDPVVFEGSINGSIVSPRGHQDFGFDYVFMPDGYDKTFAEMEKDEKNRISHRSLAIRKLYDFLKQG
jgi:inosine triphosphate pyrophosphatase